MAERTRASVELQMRHQRRGSGRNRRWRYQYKGDELKGIRKESLQSNAYIDSIDAKRGKKEDPDKYEAAVTHCWLTLLYYDQLEHAGLLLPNVPGACEYMGEWYWRDNFSACDSATPTSMYAVKRYIAEKEQAGRVAMPLTLIKGEDAYYKMRPMHAGCAVDGRVLVSVDDYLTIKLEQFVSDTDKVRKATINYYCKLLGVPMPRKSDYSKAFAISQVWMSSQFKSFARALDLAFAAGHINYEDGPNPKPNFADDGQWKVAQEKITKVNIANAELDAIADVLRKSWLSLGNVGKPEAKPKAAKAKSTKNKPKSRAKPKPTKAAT